MCSASYTGERCDINVSTAPASACPSLSPGAWALLLSCLQHTWGILNVLVSAVLLLIGLQHINNCSKYSSGYACAAVWLLGLSLHISIDFTTLWTVIQVLQLAQVPGEWNFIWCFILDKNYKMPSLSKDHLSRNGCLEKGSWIKSGQEWFRSVKKLSPVPELPLPRPSRAVSVCIIQVFGVGLESFLGEMGSTALLSV